jgi:hypothetical protein
VRFGSGVGWNCMASQVLARALISCLKVHRVWLYQHMTLIPMLNHCSIPSHEEENSVGFTSALSMRLSLSTVYRPWCRLAHINGFVNHRT